MSLEDLKVIIKETPISSIIGHYLPTKKNGNYHTSLCPFHQDKNPSLTINDEKQMFMCFACDTGGDAITFVQKYKQLDFIESLKEISLLLNLDFNTFHKDKKYSPKLKNAKKLLEAANRIYNQIGCKGPPAHFENFLRERKLSKENREMFQIGFSQKSNTIKNYIETFQDEKTKNLLIDLALELGLIKRDKKNPKTFYDTFRDRIMFPIWDQFGSIQGFTSRSINNFQKPKYLNSPASLVFDKKNLLYPLHLAKNSIRSNGHIIICEGNMDAIALHKNGFDNSVAIMGTAFGDQSLKLIKNITTNVYLCLDNDAAGKKAMKKINLQFLKLMIVPKFIDLSPYKDPDDFLSHLGPEAFQSRIDQGQAYIDHLTSIILKENISETSEERLATLNKVFEVLAPLGTTLSALERIMECSKKIGLKSAPLQIEESYKKFLLGNVKKAPPLDQGPPPEPQKKPLKQQVKGPAQPKIKISRSERLLIKGIVQRCELLTHNDFAEILDLVVNTEVKRYISRLTNLIFEIEDREYHSFVKALMMGGEFPLEIKEIAGVALYQLSLERIEDKVKSRFFSDIKIELGKDSLKNKKKLFMKSLKESSSEEESKAIMNELYRIEQNLQNLKSKKFQSQ